MGKKKFHCKSEAQKKAIKRSYAIKAQGQQQVKIKKPYRENFPDKFPFWARLRIGKKRTALVIDEEQDEKEKLQFVHREATSVYHKGFEEVNPNPDKDRTEPMYLKRAEKKPIKLFEPHNKELDMPEELRKRYDKNNHKNDD